MIETMIETKHIIAELSVTEKICLYNALYEDLAGKGIEGDTELAHVNKEEMVVLRDMGGSGTINPNTGLIQFGGGSPPPPPPANQTVSQTSEFPTELKPFVTDVLGKAQAIQEKRETEGYIPFEGPQVAGFTPEQEQAFSGIQGLVGQGQQYFDPSTQLTASASRTPTGAEISSYMSPYVQQVVDIQKREALRQGDVAQQGLAAQAVGAGGYGGSRMAILEAEQNRNLQQQLGDIQTRGIAAAYEDAQARLAQQRQREFTGSSQFAQLGQVAPQQALKELTAVEAIGAQRQAQSQQGLNIAKQQFQEEQIFPEQTLQQYQSVIRGFPLAPSTYQQSQTTTPAPSYLQQAAGLGTTAIGLAGAFGGFGKAQGGLVSRMSGGQVDQTNGLGSIVVKKKEGGNFVPPTRSSFTDPNYQNPIGKDIEALVDALARGLIDPPTFEARIEQLQKGYNKAGMPLEQEPIPKELGRSPLSVSPIEARMKAQERKAGLSSADQPITPSLETDEEARRMLRQRQLEGTSTDLLNRAIIRQEAEAGRGASDVGMADPFPSDYKISSKETEAEARRMARERQLRSLLPTKKKAEAPRSIEKSMIDPASSLAMLNTSMRDPKFAAANTMGISKEAQALKDLDPTSALAMLRDAAPGLERQRIKADKANTVPPEAVTMYGQGDVGDMLSEERSRIAAALPKQSATTAPAVSDEMLSNAEMAGMREGLKDFAPLTSDPETAKDVDKLEIGTAQKASSTFTQNIADNPLLTTANKEAADIKKQLDTLATSKKARLDARKKGLNSDRWLAVANLGANILAQPGGQTFLQAIGKGAKDSGIIGSLSKLNREEADIADKLETIDLDTLMKKYKLSKDEAATFASERAYGLQVRKLNADISFNNSKIDLLRQQGKIKEANLLAKKNKDLEDARREETKPLTEKQFKAARDTFTGYWNELKETSDGKKVAKLLKAKSITMTNDQNISNISKMTRSIMNRQGVSERDAYRMAINSFLKSVTAKK